MKKFLTNIKEKTPQAIVPTLIAGIIFLITYFCFGAGNSMIGPFVTLAYINFRNMKDNLGCMVRHFAIFTVMACAAYIAVMTPALCVIVNAIMLFWIAYLLINEYQPSNYFPSGMALIFFQISPALTPSELLTRILALTVSFVIIFMFVWVTILTHKKREPLLELIEQGFEVCGGILELLKTTSISGEPAQSVISAQPAPSSRPEEPVQSAQPTISPQPEESTQLTLQELRQRLREINHSVAMEIYAYNRSSLKRKGAVNWFCRFLLFFQSFDFMTAEAVTSDGTTENLQQERIVSNSEKTYPESGIAASENTCPETAAICSDNPHQQIKTGDSVFAAAASSSENLHRKPDAEASAPAENLHRKPDVEASAPAENLFRKPDAEASAPAENLFRKPDAEASAPAENLHRKPDVEASASIEKAAELYEKFRHQFQSDTPASDYKKLILRDNRPDIRSFRFRFALRMVLVMTPVLTFCLMSSLQNVYWLAISVFFMMIPFSNETMRRVRERVIGSMIGILICFALFSLFPGLAAHIIIMMIANFFIYTASSYTSTVAYITCSALAVQTAEAFAVTALEQRLVYTLIGAAIAIIANRFIFPIRMDRQIEYIKELLARIRSQLTALNDSGVPAEIYVSFGMRRTTDRQLDVACLAHQSDQLIVKSYLLSGRLRQLNEAMPENKRDTSLTQLEQEHLSFMSDYLAKYL